MANLPENKTYNTPRTNYSIPKVPSYESDVADLQSEVAKDKAEMFPSLAGGMPTGPGGVPDAFNNSTVTPTNFKFKPTAAQAPIIPGGNTFVDKSVELNRAQPFGESGYDAEFAFGERPSNTSVIRTTPNMGQWIHDPANPDKIYRSERPEYQTWSAIRKAALEGRDSDIYELDHVVPLWLGGTNNQENLQVLDRISHSKKIKAEAVALTLYANDRISRDDAMKIAMTWDNRDLTDFPEISQNAKMENGQNGGQMALSDAQKVYDRWKQQEGTIPKVSIFKNFFKKETALRRGDYIDEKTEALPDAVQGLLKGFLSAGSANAIQYRKSANDGGWDETAGNIIGMIGGSLLPIGAIGKGLGAVRGLNKLRIASGNSLRAKGILKTGNAATSVGNVATNLTAGTATKAAQLGKKLPFSKGTVDPKMQAMIRAHSNAFVKWTPPVALYGQAAVSFEDEPERGARLFEDIMYGGLTGFMSPTLLGSAKAAAMAGTASLMFDAYSDNREVSWENALINGLTIGALHGISAPGMKKDAAVELRRQNVQAANDETVRMANNIISLYVPGVKKVGEKQSVPSYTKEEIDTIAAEARESLLKQVGGDAKNLKQEEFLNDSELVRQSQALSAAIDSLYINSIDQKELPKYLSTRLQQWADLANDPKKRDEAFGGSRSPHIEKIYENMPKDLFNKRIPYEASTFYPSGFQRTTGLAEGHNSDTGDIAKIIARSAAGRVSPTMVAVTRPEREALFRILAQDPKVKFQDEFPENSLQVIAFSTDERGNPELLNGGYIPQEKRIEGEPYSFNSQAEIKSGKFPKYPVEVNKNSIASKLRAEGGSYLFVTFNKADYVKKADGTNNLKYPYLEFQVGEQHWKRSLEHQLTGKGSVAPTVAEDGADAVLKRANDSTNKEVISKAQAEYINSYSAPAHTALLGPAEALQSVDQDGLTMARSYLNKGAEALEAPSAQEMANKLDDEFGFILSVDAADVLFQNRRNLTTKEYFELIYQKSNATVQKVLSDQVFPPLRELQSSDWDKAEVFRQLRVLGREQAKKAEAPLGIKHEVAASQTGDTPPTVNLAQEAAETVVAGAPGVVSPQSQVLANAVKSVAQVRAPELLPTVKPVEQIVAAKAETVNAPAVQRPTQQVVEELYPKMKSAVEVLAPDAIPMRTERQTYIDKLTEQTISEGKQALQNVRFTSRNGEGVYLKQLGGIVRNIEPAVTASAPAAGGQPLSRIEKNVIKQDVMDELAREANRVFTTKIEPGGSLNISNTGVKKGEEYFEEMVLINDALNMKQLGLPGEDPLIALRENMGDKVFDAAYRLLNPGKSAENIGKKPEPKKKSGKVGYKGGLLGDNFVDVPAASGRDVIKQLVDKPKTAKAGTYMHVFSDVVETAFTKQLGKDWRKNDDIAKVFSTLPNRDKSQVWDNLLIRSEGDATQPIEYIKTLGKGQKAKARRVADERREEVWTKRQEQLDELSLQRVSDEGVVSGGNRSEGAERIMEEGQIDAPSPMDTVLAGLTDANNSGYQPTAEQALADAIQFVFAVNKAQNIKFNTKAATEVVDEVLGRLSGTGARLSNVKNPTKKAGTYFTEARDAKRKADELLKGQLQERFKTLLTKKSPSGVMYSDFPSVKNADSMMAKLEALGAAAKKNLRDIDYGKTSKAGNALRTTPEERLFNDSFTKWQNMMTEVDELNRSKEIMKADAKAAKKSDGQGYPGPMDGKGGIFGDLIGKVKGFMKNEHTYIKPEKQASNVIGATQPHKVEQKPAQLNFKPPVAPKKAQEPKSGPANSGLLQGEWKGTNYDPYDRYQNRIDATDQNIGQGAVTGVTIGKNMAAVSRIPNSPKSEIRLGTVIRDPNTGEIYLIADLMNRRFDGQKKIDFATPYTGKEINPKYNQMFSGFEILRQGAGYEDAREFVNSGEWERMLNGS